MVYNALDISANNGLLELDDYSKYDFTVNDYQYDDLVKDQYNVIKQFTINAERNLIGNDYIIKENGILVTKEGLHIINHSNAKRIVFHSTSDDWINLLGSVQVNNNQAELVFISSYKINCNGCNFPGVNRVTFTDNNYKPNYNMIYIGSLGLLSTSNNLDIVAGDLKILGDIDVNQLKIIVKNSIDINANIHTNDNINTDKPVPMKLHINKSSKIESIGNMELAGEKIELYGEVKSNQKIAISSADLNIYGKLLSDSLSLITDSTYISGGKIEAQKISINFKSSVKLDDKSILTSYGDLDIRAPKSNLDSKVEVISSTVSVSFDADIIASWFYVHKSGEYRIEREQMSGYKHRIWPGKAETHMNGCYKEIFKDNTDIASKILIGGSLYFEGSKLENDLSVFKAGSYIASVGAQVIDKKLELRKVAEFGTGAWCCKRNGWSIDWRVQAMREELAEHCGMDSKGLETGPLSEIYQTITQPIIENSKDVLNELKFDSNYNKVTISHNNHYKKLFNDQSIKKSNNDQAHNTYYSSDNFDETQSSRNMFTKHENDIEDIINSQQNEVI